MRKIIHIDMDAFYASIEQRDNPDLQGKPVAVGYSGARGVVAAASYESRKYGVRSAMPSTTALRKCPHLIFVPGRFDVYKEVSAQIMEIFLEYTDLVEPLSLDEAFLDVTLNHKGIASATQIAVEIKQKIKERTNLTASAGVSFNKFLAKIASDYNKPDGLFVIKPRAAEKFIEELKVERFFGVGKVTAEKMHSLRIFTGADLKSRSEAELVAYFGKAGHSYYAYARGIDERPVVPDRVRKSVGAENTFLDDKTTYEQLETELVQIAERVWHRTGKRDFYGRTITLKIKYADFEIITRSHTYSYLVKDYPVLLDTVKRLLRGVDLSRKGVRLLGISVSNTDQERRMLPRQLEFDFETNRI